MAQTDAAQTTRRLGVLIGGSGLVGGTIVNYFKSRTTAPIDILAPSSKKLSIREPADIKSYLTTVKPDFIINTAIANIDSDSQMSYEINYSGPINLAMTAAELNIPYIHLSSAATLKTGQNIDETQTREFSHKMSNYAKTKLMTEKTLEYLHKKAGLDYSCIRLSVVYGNHDHKIQGFHRMLFSIADESMPFLFTSKGVHHSYSNCRKLPYFIHHMIDNRQEFSGQTYNFADRLHVNLPDLILTIKSYLQLRRPYEIYVPYQMANIGKRCTSALLRVMRNFGLKANLPPELIFIRNFYTTQTLNTDKLQGSSFEDPMPNETVYTRMPDMVIYYLTRWSQQNLITTYDEEIRSDGTFEQDFKHRPEILLEQMHKSISAGTSNTEIK
ncbi:NAD-dependent epimerase/dehydratase family protein [Desulfopila sp. IMCC35008]|uniref:NAD-dependent epimerase/dehydratase family protein n=1 Tax=Desulfopila sp. IMCC35008 TaxID=2653858 RepID=UPI0013D1EF76|nr:NAD-dependent epimerase/dehydratase family protein [Desulfopila sp. IMCC35008]